MRKNHETNTQWRFKREADLPKKVEKGRNISLHIWGRIRIAIIVY